ncbi:thiosulfate oxidation carrier protein SoxY [Caldimonas caldifontis]|uniref:Thiosulfate oxidation carrier protein SoxY n=1 Tax=Caldimonas caldifontis TaxID=1452508 RepID=A0A2S5SWT8_9BURK|nr:thiosulfate oxidation carrier protein SoxY [Caldimonas caldifontis]PPE67223.1 thiosulfate oxidation carrier protein SoxY [Caldimonas caldifontis]
MHTRRQMLKRSAAVASLMAAAGVWPGTAFAQGGYAKAAFEAKSMAELTKALGLATPTESKDITVTGPDIAENGAVVPLGAATTLPGVKRMMLLVEKNPNMLAALFDFSDAVDPAVSTRVKMGQSSDVFAVAVMNDGRVLYGHKEIKVTLGGCGG